MSNSLKNAARILLRHHDNETILEQSLCAELGRERKRRKCTGSEFAAELGISPQYLSDLMRGRRSVSFGLLKKILGE